MEIREIHSWQRAPLGSISRSKNAIALCFQHFTEQFKQKDSL